MTSWPFYQSMIDLEQFGTWFRDTWSMILRFSLIANFYLKKNKNRTKKIYYCQTILIFLKNNAGISKIEMGLVLKGTFSETKYLFVLTFQISSFQHNPNKFKTLNSFNHPLSHHHHHQRRKTNSQKLTQIRVNIEAKYQLSKLHQTFKSIYKLKL